MKLKFRGNYDVIIIGGGFYGCVLALYFKKNHQKVLIIEKENDLLLRASYVNQARIHNGYHYPRHYITGVRSRLNYDRFIKDYKKAVYNKHKQYYAIASTHSKTTPRQFVKFSEHIGSPVKSATEKVKRIFNDRLIDDVFEVEECVFDAGKLRKLLHDQLIESKIPVIYENEVTRVVEKNKKLISETKNGNCYSAKQVFNCTYSKINKILINSDLSILPLKHEFIEMPLIEVPDELKNISVTILDGPFFGFLPFPDRGVHSLWHVRYSVLHNWSDPPEENIGQTLYKISKESNYDYMKRDMQRFIPLLSESIYKESLFAVKTVLISKEENDGRPILYKKDHGLRGLNVVMGGKIDNIYDILEKVQEDF